jgi:uncharacterized protein (TIGR02145 family)
MKIGYRNNSLIRIPIKKSCQGYYLRWWYNGWHYWFFLPGRLSLTTEGEKYRTIGTRRIAMGTGQITREQCDAIRTITNTKEIYLLTTIGWMNLRIEQGSITVYDNQIEGDEFDFIAIVGSREDYFSPVIDLPDSPSNPSKYIYGFEGIYITHHTTVFTMILTGNGVIIINWGDRIIEIYMLTDTPQVITHIYTDGIYEHTIGIDGEEHIITLDASGNHITEIIIPPTAISLTELILDNNDLTDVYIPPTVPLVSLTLTNNPLAICEVVIGTQIWMCYNYDSSFPGSKVYNDDEANRTVYGGLYTYNQVITAGFTPAMWHVPTKDEWIALITYIGTLLTAGGILKEVGLTHWNAPNTGAVDTYGFAARGAGIYFYLFGFIQLKETTYFWTADENDSLTAWIILMQYNHADIVMPTTIKNLFSSVRLLKNFSYAPPLSTMTDIDGNVYIYVTLGAQQWMIENLRTTHYADGTAIPEIISGSGTNYTDWFLPSKNLLNEIYINLYLFGVGNFIYWNLCYWSSTESAANAAWMQRFDTGAQQIAGKTGTNSGIRPCRSFTAAIGAYNLRDIGPAGGWICYISGTTYYEIAPNDIGNQHAANTWSNVDPGLIGTTLPDISESQNNTNEIIAQPGHITSAALLCDNISIVGPGWMTDLTGAYCWQNNNIANKIPFGALYNWYAVNNAHGLAPAGWRVPSEADWHALFTYLGNNLFLIGGMLKEKNCGVHWACPNTGAVNTAKFYAVGAGSRSGGDGLFKGFYTTTYFWASDITANYHALSYLLSSISDGNTEAKNYGLSVRCMRDTP